MSVEWDRGQEAFREYLKKQQLDKTPEGLLVRPVGWVLGAGEKRYVNAFDTDALVDILAYECLGPKQPIVDLREKRVVPNDLELVIAHRGLVDRVWWNNGKDRRVIKEFSPPVVFTVIAYTDKTRQEKGENRCWATIDGFLAARP